MALISDIAQRVLDENNYNVGNISLTNLEYNIDNAIHYINLMAGTSIADLAGVADSKTLTGTDSEIVVVKTLSALLIRAYLDRGPNVTVTGVGVAAAIADPQYKLLSMQVQRGIDRLWGHDKYTSRSFERT